MGVEHVTSVSSADIVGVLTIISAIVAGVISIIRELRESAKQAGAIAAEAASDRARAEESLGKKLDTVHDAVNGGYGEVKQQLSDTRIELLTTQKELAKAVAEVALARAQLAELGMLHEENKRLKADMRAIDLRGRLESA